MDQRNQNFHPPNYTPQVPTNVTTRREESQIPIYTAQSTQVPTNVTTRRGESQIPIYTAQSTQVPTNVTTRRGEPQIPIYTTQSTQSRAHLLPTDLLEEINKIQSSPRPIVNSSMSDNPANIVAQPILNTPIFLYKEPVSPHHSRAIIKNSGVHKFLSCGNGVTSFDTAPPSSFLTPHDVQTNECQTPNTVNRPNLFRPPMPYTPPPTTTYNVNTGAVPKTPALHVIRNSHRPDVPLIQEHHILNNLYSDGSFHKAIPWSTNDMRSPPVEPMPFPAEDVPIDLGQPVFQPHPVQENNICEPMQVFHQTSNEPTMWMISNETVNGISPLNEFQQGTLEFPFDTDFYNPYLMSSLPDMMTQMPPPPSSGMMTHMLPPPPGMMTPVLPPPPPGMMQAPALPPPLASPGLLLPQEPCFLNRFAAPQYLPPDKYKVFEILELIQKFKNWEYTQNYKNLVIEEIDKVLTENEEEEAAGYSFRPPEEIPSDLQEELGHYKLCEKIGSGSISYVYRATDSSNNSIAVKLLYVRKKTREYFPQIANEIAFLKMLDHPNIINHVCGEIKKTCMFLAVEYSPYGSLRNFIPENSGMSEKQVQMIIEQLASALYYLHSMRIYHGNIKPENVMIMNPENYQIKLTDFLSTKVCIRGLVFHKRSGAPFYIAPEVHLGCPADHKSDLFSLGILMYEMLFDDFPYEHNLTKRQLLIHLREKRPLDFSKFHLLSPNCRELLDNLLSYEPQKRFSGRNLICHPFVNGVPIEDSQNHLHLAYDRFLKGLELANQKHYGQAYIDVYEAVIHLQVYLDTAYNIALQENAVLKIRKYKRFMQLLQERIVSDYIMEPFMIPSNTEKLRCLLYFSPELLEGFDLCVQGEMFFRLNEPHAIPDLRRGLNIIFDQIFSEQHGLRRNLLVEKIKRWLTILNII